MERHLRIYCYMLITIGRHFADLFHLCDLIFWIWKLHNLKVSTEAEEPINGNWSVRSEKWIHCQTSLRWSPTGDNSSILLINSEIFEKMSIIPLWNESTDPMKVKSLQASQLYLRHRTSISGPSSVVWQAASSDTRTRLQAGAKYYRTFHPFHRHWGPVPP